MFRGIYPGLMFILLTFIKKYIYLLLIIAQYIVSYKGTIMINEKEQIIKEIQGQLNVICTDIWRQIADEDKVNNYDISQAVKHVVLNPLQDHYYDYKLEWIPSEMTSVLTYRVIANSIRYKKAIYKKGIKKGNLIYRKVSRNSI